jgi:hypothetical protein
MKKCSVSLSFILGAAALVAGCSTAAVSSDAGQARTGGTSGGGGGGSGGTLATVAGVEITPDATGFVMGSAANKMIQGSWYGYGDHYGTTGAPPGDCETKGMHPATACSVITSPTLPAPVAPATNAGFPNVSGKMCATGTAAMVVAGAAGALDYDNVWGAGIALDLNNSGGANAAKLPYDAVANGVKGFSFVFENRLTPAPVTFSMRVEFPTMPAPAAAFWAGNLDQPSPVMPGLNVVHWADVKGPFYNAAAPAFDPTKIMSIQFHIYTGGGGARPFNFCISNLKALTE